MFKVITRKLNKSGIVADQHGFTLLELIIAILFISIIAVALFTAFATGSKVTTVTRSQETAKDIAISDMENIESQPYAQNYTIFSPSSGPGGTIIAVPAGSGWVASDTISSVTLGGIAAPAQTLTVIGNSINGNTIYNVSGTITVPSSLTAGPCNVVITGTTTGALTFPDAFTATNVAVTPTEYSNYISALEVTPIQTDDNEQEIIVTISLNGKTLFTLTDYRTDY